MKRPALPDAWRARWQALSERERALVVAAAVAVAALLLWLVLLRPVWRIAQTVPAELAATETHWLRMQAQAAEARELRGLPPLAPDQARQALQAATERLGTGHARLQWQGDRATVFLTQASPTAWQAWLTEIRQGARARPVEMQLRREAQGLSGQIVLELPAAAP